MQPSGVLTLQRDEGRYGFFAAHRHARPFFDEGVGAWIVADPAHVERLLEMPSLKVIDYGAAYRNLERAGRHGFPNIRFASAHLSLSLNGDEHRHARRRIGEQIGKRRGVLAAATPGLVADAFAPLRTAEEVDLVEAVLAPLVARIMASLVEVDADDFAAIGGVSIVFDLRLGLTKRLRLEQAAAELRALIRRSGGASLPEDEEGFRLALLILGSDALLGTLGESLGRILAAAPGRSFPEIAYPATPPEPGVSMTERLVSEPFEFEGVRFAAGERLRFLLQAVAYSDDPAMRGRVFGFGARTCLGRALSLDVWREICGLLSRLDRRQEVVRFAPRTSDYVFTCPETLVVRLS